MSESNLVICKVCEQPKQRVCIGTYTSKNRKYTDQHGKLWNGKVCPQCHRNKIKNSMYTMRELRKLSNNNDQA